MLNSPWKQIANDPITRQQVKAFKEVVMVRRLAEVQIEHQNEGGGGHFTDFETCIAVGTRWAGTTNCWSTGFSQRHKRLAFDTKEMLTEVIMHPVGPVTFRRN